MRFRGLSGIFSRVSLLSGWSLLAVAFVLIFDLAVAAAGPNSNPVLRVEVTLVPSVQTTQNTTPAIPSATIVTPLDSAKEIKVEWNELAQNSIIPGANQAQFSGAAQNSARNAVLETFTVVSP